MIKKAKAFELMIFFKNRFEHIWLKSAFDPKNHSFENVLLTKKYSYLCDRKHECIIYMI
jgi:hypothetical protein